MAASSATATNVIPLRPIGKPPRQDPKFCDWCNQPFWPRREDQRFCKKACRQGHHHQNAARGAEILKAAMAWRKTRAKGGLTALQQLTDEFVREDRAAEKKREADIAAYRRTTGAGCR